MTTPDTWRKSATPAATRATLASKSPARPTHIAVRDSKTPTRAVLVFPAPAFEAFITALKLPDGGPERA